MDDLILGGDPVRIFEENLSIKRPLNPSLGISDGFPIRRPAGVAASRIANLGRTSLVCLHCPGTRSKYIFFPYNYYNLDAIFLCRSSKNNEEI